MLARTFFPAAQGADSLVTSLGDRLSGMIGFGPNVQMKIALSVLVVLVVWLARRLILRAVERRVDDVPVRYQWAKGTAYGASLTGLAVVGGIWLEGITSLGTFLGLLTAGLAIALKDLVANFAGWIFILWRRPFEMGDRVQLGSHAGDVVDIRIFQFTLLEIGNWVGADQSTGRVIHVPNARLFSEPLANYTGEFEYIWNEVPVLVTFESNWERARDILRDVAVREIGEVTEEAERSRRKAARKFLINYPKLTPIVYLTVKDSGVLLTLRYLCRPRERRGTEQVIWEAVLRGFAQAGDIDLAYPTQRFFYNATEGKEELRPGEASGDPVSPGPPGVEGERG